MKSARRNSFECRERIEGGSLGDYEKGKPITGLAEANAMEDVVVVHAGTKGLGDKVVTAGGRVLGVTAIGESFEIARQRCYDAVDRIHFDGAYCQRDIGAQAMNKPTFPI